MADKNTRLRHRCIFDLHALDEEASPLAAVADLVVDWFVKKELQYEGSPVVEDFSREEPFPLAFDYRIPEDYEGGDYEDDKWPAIACLAERAPGGEISRWAVEYDEPDVHAEDRRWHTNICLSRTEEDACRVAIQTVCRTRDDEDDLPETIAAPSLVRTILELPGFVAKRGTTKLETAPVKLTTETFPSFAEALVDPGRLAPLVLFCTGYDGKVPEQAKQLARRAIGLANVYMVDWSNEPLREMELALFERGTSAGEYACPRSSCRMYLPGVDLSDPHRSMSHESWNRDAIEAVQPSRFAESIARRFLPSEVVPGVADLA